jgi:hypothetical protein
VRGDVTLDGYARRFTKDRETGEVRETLYLVYEAYEPMAIKEMEKLVKVAHEQFEIANVGIVPSPRQTRDRRDKHRHLGRRTSSQGRVRCLRMAHPRIEAHRPYLEKRGLRRWRAWVEGEYGNTNVIKT